MPETMVSEDFEPAPRARRLKHGPFLQEEIITSISGDRRSRRRYDIGLPCQYKLMRGRQIWKAGSGRTLNVSACGLAVEIGEVLEPGAAMELSLAWPARLHGVCALQLVVTGKIVRSDGKLTAVRMERYEFRTQGARTANAAGGRL